ncbi:ABC transporter ATP-binding protein [Clostridiaceae bacterium M8S5]|nr:ABC transporter ATP-binding protein [Clostridiaceae bacterium M8S5]
MLVASNISKTYTFKEKKKFHLAKRKRVCAVKKLSLELEKGKIIGLLGVNGAGKTTTIKMLCGIIDPTSGSIMIDGIDSVKYYKKVKEKLNLITGGERNLYWRLSARENLEYFGSLYGIQKKELDKRIDKLLDMVDLKDSENMPVERYSKGMKQRLQIARGVINDPDYIFLDEPTLGLDINIAQKMRTYIKKLATDNNKGILLTTHYITEAEELCDYIYIIDKGQIIAKDTPEGLKKMLKSQKETLIKVENMKVNFKKSLSILAEKEKFKLEFDEIENLVKITSCKSYNADIFKMIAEYECGLLSVLVKEPSLENILLDTLLGGGKNEEVH